MNFRKKPRDNNIELSMAPLIDVVFLLLIFFMVTSNFSKETQISVNLPSAHGKASEDTQHALEVSVDKQGHIYVNGKPLVNTRFETLKRAIRKESGLDTEQPFIITGDAKAPHQAIVMVMDAAGQLGFAKVRITTRRANASS